MKEYDYNRKPLKNPLKIPSDKRSFLWNKVVLALPTYSVTETLKIM